MIDWLAVVLFSCGEHIGSVSVFVCMKLKHYIMKHDSTNLFVRHTPTESGPRASTPPAGAGMPLWLM